MVSTIENTMQYVLRDDAEGHYLELKVELAYWTDSPGCPGDRVNATERRLYGCRVQSVEEAIVFIDDDGYEVKLEGDLWKWERLAKLLLKDVYDEACLAVAGYVENLEVE